MFGKWIWERDLIDTDLGIISLSMVAPAYNEENNIDLFTRTTDQALIELGLSDYELIIVDDGSYDGTWEKLRSLENDFQRLRIYRHEKNIGYGAALLNGMTKAKMKYIAYTDTDMQFDLLDLSQFFSFLGDFDVVLGYRENRSDPSHRILIANGYNELCSRIFDIPGIRDIDCSLKLISKTAFESIEPKRKGFGFDLEIVTKLIKKGYSVAQVPVNHRQRHSGGSKVNLFQVLRTLKEMYYLSRELTTLNNSE
jgi:dolichol-phosphate mannosyltransferase